MSHDLRLALEEDEEMGLHVSVPESSSMETHQALYTL